jgi:hypothetical protein
MTKRPADESSEKFEYSKAALDQYYASRSRYKGPFFVMVSILLLIPLRKYEVLVLVLLGVGGIAGFVMVAQNYRVGRRADKRLHMEKREWDARHHGPS